MDSSGMGVTMRRAGGLERIDPFSPEHEEVPPVVENPHIVVQDSPCAVCAIPTKRVFHRDFPELWAEGGSAVEGAERLAWQLAQALDGAPGHWHRFSLQKAVSDVVEFLTNLAGALGSEAAAHCARHAAHHHTSILKND